MSGFGCTSPKPQDPADPIHLVSAEDPDMTAAIAKARATLPDFYRHWKNPGPGEADFSLKWRDEQGENVEHLWISDLKGSPGHLTGIVNDTPQEVTNVKLGQRIAVPDDQISDWLYVHNGKMVGNQTMSPVQNAEPR